jgi:hypothetical protein
MPRINAAVDLADAIERIRERHDLRLSEAVAILATHLASMADALARAAAKEKQPRTIP